MWQGGVEFDRHAELTIIKIENMRQLVENINYIHHNPVKAEIVKNEVDYLWSTA